MYGSERRSTSLANDERIQPPWSSCLKMTLVATTTVVLVSGLTFLIMGVTALKEDAKDKSSLMMLVVGGALLLTTSIVQIVTVCLWTGWCVVITERPRLEPAEEIIARTTVVAVPTATNAMTTTVDLENDATANEWNSRVTPMAPPRPRALPRQTASPCFEPIVEYQAMSTPVSRNYLLQRDPIDDVSRGGANTFPRQYRAIMSDAATSTRELRYLSPRGYAPLALQEDMTPSLRSSFTSFDELA